MTEQPCAVVYRDGRNQEWKLQCFTEKTAVAMESARMTLEQEERLGHSAFEIIVVTAKHYDSGDVTKPLWRGKAKKPAPAGSPAEEPK